jgi:hypothetical protein
MASFRTEHRQLIAQCADDLFLDPDAQFICEVIARADRNPCPTVAKHALDAKGNLITQGVSPEAVLTGSRPTADRSAAANNTGRALSTP